MSRSASPRRAEKDALEVAGRGELQLGVLIETMRREGFELSISRPRVLYRDGPNGREEPYETVVIDVDDEHAGTVVEKMAQRKGEMTDMRPSGGGKTRLTFSAPSRGLIGYHGEFLSDTRGTGIMNRLFERYGPYKGPIQGRQNGVLISMEKGEAVAYALNALEERGILFISPGEALYEGMVIGENAKPQDLEVNPAEVQAAHQLPRLGRQGREHPPHPAAADDARAGDRLHPGRRAGRGHAQGDPHPQALSRSARAQAPVAQGRGGLVNPPRYGEGDQRSVVRGGGAGTSSRMQPLHRRLRRRSPSPYRGGIICPSSPAPFPILDPHAQAPVAQGRSGLKPELVLEILSAIS